MVGGDAVEQYDEHDDRIWLVDRVVEAARKMGWVKLTRTERLALPVYDAKEHAPKAKPAAPAKAKTKTATKKVASTAKRKRKRKPRAEV
jgi:hypothetical protein